MPMVPVWAAHCLMFYWFFFVQNSIPVPSAYRSETCENLCMSYIKYYLQIKTICRPLDVPDNGLVCDLLWGDPDEVSNSLALFYCPVGLI